MTPPRKGPARSGSLYWTKSGWRGRIRMDVDGETVQKSFDLGTHDRSVANIKLRRLVKEASPSAPSGELADPARVETFEEAARRLDDESTLRTKKARLDRLKMHAFPAFGSKLVTELVAGDVRDLLKALADDGASKETCVKIRNDVSSVLGELWRTDMIPENVCKKVRIPKNAKIDKRERAVLSDDELVRYLAWRHPNEKKQKAVLERQTIACVSRMFGGLRLGDIKAIRWEAFSIDEGRFPTGWVPREKTARAQLLEVPEMLRPILNDWWHRAGKPSEGFLFPVRRGKRAGEQKRAGSPAAALRRDLVRAFGIERPVAVPFTRSNGRPDVVLRWAPARDMTPRERELLTETEFTRPVEFHSFRRAFKQGLADAGVELQTAMTLSGASDAKTHRRYLANTAKARQIPAAALPLLSMSHAQLPEPENDSSIFSGGRSRDRTCGFVRVKDALYR
jgi:integrase